jgi:hypothetical protein
MAGRDFKHPSGKMVRYNCGQPMGLLTSWSIFSLTHHAFVEFCAFRVGLKQPFKDYVVLGDDIAIFNTEVRDEYVAQLNKLGVEYSEPKTFE